MDSPNHPFAEALKARLAPPVVEEADVARVWAGIETQLNTPVIARRRNVSVWHYLSIAAAIAFVAIGVRFFPSKTIETKTYATAIGQRANITLPSGIQVILAPATKLIVAGTEVTLTGQALFTVKHNTSSPFTVRAGNSITRVLGTTFAVRAYEADSNVRVFVTEGKVSVGNSSVLVAGDAAKVARDGRIIPITDLDLTTALGWTEGKLVFRKATLAEVLAELERMYDVRFKLANSDLGSAEVTTTLLDRDLQGTLYKLSELLGARYVVEGQMITFIRN